MNRRHAMAVAAIASGVISLAGTLAVVVSILAGSPPDRWAMIGAIILCAGASVAMMVFLALYVYVDANARGMKGVFWALLIFLFAGFPGFVVYLLMRPPLRTTLSRA